MAERPATARRNPNGSCSPATPLRRYFSRRSSLRIPELPTADDFVGIYSPWAVLWGLLFMTMPLSYFYIALVLLRELCRNYPSLLEYYYLPSLVGTVVNYMQQKSWRIVEYWCWLEAVFYILMKVKIKLLQMKDPLEASLSAAPLLELEERAILWRRMMESEVEDPLGFLTGWFFDCNIESITKYDVRDFCAWCMFEGRHQEHLTTDELRQLEEFVEEAEQRISLQLYGEAEDVDEVEEVDEWENLCGKVYPKNSKRQSRLNLEGSQRLPAWKSQVLPKPKMCTCSQYACMADKLGFLPLLTFCSRSVSFRRRAATGGA